MIAIRFGAIAPANISKYGSDPALPPGLPGGTLVSYTVPGGKTLRITSWKIIGSDRGHAFLLVDGAVVDELRIVGEQLNPDYSPGEVGAFPVNAGQVVEILVINYGSALREFSARFGAYLI